MHSACIILPFLLLVLFFYAPKKQENETIFAEQNFVQHQIAKELGQFATGCI